MELVREAAAILLPSVPGTFILHSQVCCRYYYDYHIFPYNFPTVYYHTYQVPMYCTPRYAVGTTIVTTIGTTIFSILYATIGTTGTFILCSQVSCSRYHHQYQVFPYDVLPSVPGISILSAEKRQHLRDMKPYNLNYLNYQIWDLNMYLQGKWIPTQLIWDRLVTFSLIQARQVSRIWIIETLPWWTKWRRCWTSGWRRVLMGSVVFHIALWSSPIQLPDQISHLYKSC